MHLDCIRERDIATLESPRASGRSPFDSEIADSTRRQLAAAFRNNSGVPRRMIALDTSAYVLRTREQVVAESSTAGAGRYPGTIFISRAAFSVDGYAYVYAVFSRMRFATGTIFLLRNESGRWRIVSRVGAWVT
jgi:hypothetical protein